MSSLAGSGLQAPDLFSMILMSVILIGYRGSGKTTLGKMLAQQLEMTFTDVDDEIRKRFNHQTIAQIWSQFGQPAFRKAEVEVTHELCQRKQMVIGLGGGTLMLPDARRVVERMTGNMRIYLKCEPDVLYQRICEDKATAAQRPALTAMRGSVEEIRAVLADRESVYEAVADHVLDLTKLSPDEALRRLRNICEREHTKHEEVDTPND